MTDYADLVTRLRDFDHDGKNNLTLDAADAITALVKEVDEAIANASLFLDRLIIGDKPMGEGDTVATFFKMKDRAEAAEAEVLRLRDLVYNVAKAAIPEWKKEFQRAAQLEDKLASMTDSNEKGKP